MVNKNNLAVLATGNAILAREELPDSINKSEHLSYKGEWTIA